MIIRAINKSHAESILKREKEKLKKSVKYLLKYGSSVKYEHEIYNLDHIRILKIPKYMNLKYKYVVTTEEASDVSRFLIKRQY